MPGDNNRSRYASLAFPRDTLELPDLAWYHHRHYSSELATGVMSGLPPVSWPHRSRELQLWSNVRSLTTVNHVLSAMHVNNTGLPGVNSESDMAEP